MIITFDDVKKSVNYSQSIHFDFMDSEINEVLLKKINYADVEVNCYMVSNDEVHMTLEVDYNIDYLDANNLELLELDFDFTEKPIFTTNLQKAEEYDLEYCEDEEIDIKQLVFDLIFVDVPLNYTKEKFDYSEEDEEVVQTPFANLFKKN